MYGCKSWTIKKAEHRRFDAFELWCWRRFLRVPWAARSKQSVLKGIKPEYSLEELIWSGSSNTLTTWLGPDAGKDWEQEERKMRWLDGITRDLVGEPGEPTLWFVMWGSPVPTMETKMQPAEMVGWRQGSVQCTDMKRPGRSRGDSLPTAGWGGGPISRRSTSGAPTALTLVLTLAWLTKIWEGT